MKKTAVAAFALAAIAPGAAFAQCYELSADGTEATEITDYELRAESAAPGLMERPPIAADAPGMLCVRDSVVPDANDFELVRYHGVPLLIQEGEGENARILAMSFASGLTDENGEELEPQYMVERARGDLSQDDVAAIRAALEGYAESEAALDAWMAENAQAED
ncbi:MAG: hypothetical protein ABL308_03305 [Oceanicaulis sp.]